MLRRNVSLSVLTEAANSTTCREALLRGGDGARAMQLCDRHKKPLVYYCKQDRTPVCHECGICDCKNHEKVLLETEKENQELLLERKINEVEKLVKETEEKIADLAENISQAKVSFEQTSVWVSAKFSSMMKVLGEKQEATEQFIHQQQEEAIGEAHSRTLRESRSQIKAVHNLSDTELIKESMVIEVPRLKDVATDVKPNLQDRLNAVTEILSRMSKLVSDDLDKAVSSTVGQDKDGSPQDKRPVLAVVPSPAAPSHPGGKEGLSAYRCSLTFDPRTANGNLFLSQENRRAEHLTSGPRPVPPHEARFDHTWQVLCFQGFTHGQHYWELEVSKPWAYLGISTGVFSEQVTYESIPRKEKGRRCMVGMNELSWSLQLDQHQLSAWHNGQRETLAGPAQSSRIGMLLDYEAGTLTYYGDGQTRLHAFHCAFTQELFPACWIGEGVSITLCSM
ncbi:unnamed protein product [Tetraodon nigroviridis]|uniref:(spotted green pufferfish) hypothetical protein n=1 Tax=Tetraodon nigroviridis TaxID=99883 RepID=Q4S9V8_TETNG|nr:unnamed protein product [Tetraodon nigroviridis]